MRRFIRHPVEIPIEVAVESQPRSQRMAHDLSIGGLAIESAQQFTAGTIVQVDIPFVDPPFRSRARVAWCMPRPSGYRLGVEFLESGDAFRGRMVEQVCYIQSYKKSVCEKEGRTISIEQAAIEWIGKYAGQFPALEAASD
jgi:hypothetical protein